MKNAGAPKPQPAKRRTVAELLGKIDFSPDNVIEAAAVNSVLFVDAIDYRRECLSKRNAAKMVMEQIQAGKDLNMRREARALGDKITERHIETSLLLDPDVADAMRLYDEAEELDEYSKLVVEAFRMRRDCLKIVGELMRGELSAQAAVEAGMEKMESSRRKLRERFPEG